MSTLVITGKKPLSGTHIVPGNKNAALPMMAAALLTSEPVILKNLPDIVDVRVMIEGLRALGAVVSGSPETHEIQIHAKRLNAASTLSAEICSKIRTSFLFVSPMLVRRGEAHLKSAPGGDTIGRRRLDTHIHGLRAMGARITMHTAGGCTARVLKESLKGVYYMLDEPSVMATENLVMAAVRAEGTTTLYNTACEPHVQDLCRMLNGMGAKISGIGTNRLEIEGVAELHGGTFVIGGDLIEALSYIVAALVTKGTLRLEGVQAADIDVLRPSLRTFGVKLIVKDNVVEVPAKQQLKTTYDLGKAIPRLSDGPWPMLPSDALSALLVLATQTRGTEVFFEKMFESRLYFVDHLIGMGAKIVQCDPHRAVVTGPTQLQGGVVTSPDIRAGMALIIAALCAKGVTRIHNAESIDRGYQMIEATLTGLGANIHREK